MKTSTTAAIELVLALLWQAARISEMLRTATAEGRDISIEEWGELVRENDAARTRLANAIDNAKGGAA